MPDKSATSTVPLPARLRFRMPFGRRGWLLPGTVVIAAGGALNWDWLTAIGAAPVILALAPCAVMCGLGLCMTGGGKKSCAPETTNPTDANGPEKAGR